MKRAKQILLMLLIVALPVSQAWAERAMWVWSMADDIVLDSPSGSRAVFFDFCANPHGDSSKAITTIYLSGAAPGKDLVKDYQTELRAFMADAHSRGLKIECLEGYKYWATPEYRSDGQVRCQEIIDYNVACSSDSQRFDGIHYDVEPYLLRYSNGDPYDWDSDNATVWAEYLALLDSCQGKVNTYNASHTDIVFGGAIPWWYDVDQKPGTPNEIQSRIDYVALMDYRETGVNLVDGAAGEVDNGNTLGKKVVIGVETAQAVPPDPETISFYEEGNDYMEQQLAYTETAFSGQASFNGFAIHYYEDIDANETAYRGLWTNSFPGYHPIVNVLFPNGDESIDFASGTSYDITWKTSDRDTQDSNLSIDIFYTSDGGANWTSIVSGTANDGTHTWNTTGVPTGDRYRVKVVATDPQSLGGHDSSDFNFGFSNTCTVVPDWADPQNTGINGIKPVLVPNGDDLHMVWYWPGWGGQPKGVYYRKSTDKGSSWGSTFTLAENASTQPRKPALAVKDDRLAAVWVEGAGPNGAQKVKARISTDSGDTWGAADEIQGSYSTFKWADFPDVTIDQNNKIHAVWAARMINSPNHWVIHYASKLPGSSWDTRLDVDATAYYITTPAITSDANGVHIVWSEFNWSSGWHRYIKYRKSALGGSWGAPGIIEDNVVTDDTWTKYFPDITSDNNNKLHAVWQTAGGDPRTSSTYENDTDPLTDTAANEPPELEGILDRGVSVGQELEIQLEASDYEGDNIVYAAHLGGDVSHEDVLSSLDILTLINFINGHPSETITKGHADWDPEYDVSNDAAISSLDILTLINWINAAAPGVPEKPTGTHIDGNGKFTWTPTVAQVGTHFFTFVASDANNPDAKDALTVMVTVGDPYVPSIPSDVRYSSSTDSGNSWSAPVNIGKGYTPKIASEGQELRAIYYTPMYPNEKGDIRYRRTTDGGASWVTEGIITDDARMPYYNTDADPLVGVPSLESGSMVAAWRGYSNDRIMFSHKGALSAPKMPFSDQVLGDTTTLSLSWQKPEGYLPHSYKVYRSVNDGAFSVLQETVYDTDYVDTGLSGSNYYKYKVSATNGVESLSSNVSNAAYPGVDLLVDYAEGFEGITYTKFGASTLTHSVSTSVKYEGNQSHKLDYTYSGSGWGAVLQGMFPTTFDLSSYETISLWVNGGSAGGEGIAIQFVEAGRPEGDEVWSTSSPVIPGSGWRQYEFYLTDLNRVSAEGNNNFDRTSVGGFQLLFSDSVSNGTYYVDKIELRRSQPTIEVTPSSVNFGTITGSASNHRFQTTAVNVTHGGFDTPWTVRAWTNNSPGNGGEPWKAGLRGQTVNTLYIPLKTWCVNFGPKNTSPPPGPDEENNYFWKGYDFNDDGDKEDGITSGSYQEAIYGFDINGDGDTSDTILASTTEPLSEEPVWLRIPEKDEMDANNRYSWRRYAWNDGMGYDAGLGGSFDIYFAIDTQGTKPQVYSTVVTVEYINE